MINTSYWVLYDATSDSYLKDPNIIRPLQQVWTDGCSYNLIPTFIHKGFEMTQNVFEALRFKDPELEMLERNLKHIQVYHPNVKFVQYTLTQAKGV